MENKLYLPVKDVKFNELYDWAPTLLHKDSNYSGKNRRSRRLQREATCSAGTLVECNETMIALFRVQGTVMAVGENCPHAGGPLHLGDIEVLPDRSVCVRCPWHNWKIDLMSGDVKVPKTRESVAQVYPVEVAEDGSLFIGFDSISQKYFRSDSF